jgi:hypothetical protein
MLSFVSDPEDRGDVPPEPWLIFNGLHSIIYREIVLFTPYCINGVGVCKKLWPDTLNDDRSSAAENGAFDTKKATIKMIRCQEGKF